MSDYGRFNERELIDQLHATQTALRQTQARQHAVVAELNSRGVLTEKGYRAATFLMDALNVSRSAANAIVKRADRLPAPGRQGRHPRPRSRSPAT